MWIDTHAHLYLPKFKEDIDLVMQRASDRGVEKIGLPNIDLDTIDDLFNLCDRYPAQCLPMLGLHPCSVKADYLDQLRQIEARIAERELVAIGEIGLDFYWDKTFSQEQEAAFLMQCAWAKKWSLPVVIHSRESIDRNIELLENAKMDITGVFHCFTGDLVQAKRIIDLGFYLGIGGVLTFKNSNLREVLENIPMEYLVLETDSPYLAPVPNRGKRNESAFVVDVGHFLAELRNENVGKIAQVTTANAKQLFKIS